MFVFFRIHYDSIKNRFFLCDYAEKLRTLWVVCETRVINNVQAVYCCRSIQWICLGNELQRTNGIFALSGRVDETNAKRSLSVSIFATKRKRKRTRAQRYCVNDFWKIVFGVFFFFIFNFGRRMQTRVSFVWSTWNVWIRLYGTHFSKQRLNN